MMLILDDWWIIKMRPSVMHITGITLPFYYISSPLVFSKVNETFTLQQLIAWYFLFNLDQHISILVHCPSHIQNITSQLLTDLSIKTSTTVFSTIEECHVHLTFVQVYMNLKRRRVQSKNHTLTMSISRKQIPNQIPIYFSF